MSFCVAHSIFMLQNWSIFTVKLMLEYLYWSKENCWTMKLLASYSLRSLPFGTLMDRSLEQGTLTPYSKIGVPFSVTWSCPQYLS